MGRPRGPACAREPWKRTGPGGPPGLQNRSPPADRGRAGFDSQALPPAFAHFQPALSLSELRLGRPAFARRLSRRSDARTVVHPQHREGGPEAPESQRRADPLMRIFRTRDLPRRPGRVSRSWDAGGFSPCHSWRADREASVGIATSLKDSVPGLITTRGVRILPVGAPGRRRSRRRF